MGRNSEIALGSDPLIARRARKAELTFRQLYDAYYTEYAVPHTKRPNENKKSLEYHIFPVIGDMKLTDITPEKIRKLHASMGENSGRIGANRVMGIVIAVFNYGIKTGRLEKMNPCYGLTKFRGRSRSRFLSKDELKKFFAAVKEEEQIFQDYFSLLLFTGARKSNVLSMKWADINFDLKQWCISETETKNRDVNVVYLVDQSLDILQRRLDESKQQGLPRLYVFPGPGKAGHLIDPKKAFDRIRKRMNAPDICMHDLRRTFASYMAISGVSMPIIGAALNHKSLASTAIYARLAQAPILQAIKLGIESMSS